MHNNNTTPNKDCASKLCFKGGKAEGMAVTHSLQLRAD